MPDIIIEVSYMSNIKYEIEKDSNLLRLDRILNTSMSYPGNYGFFPNTIAGDNDPLDALLITNYSLQPGVIVSTKIIGVLITVDEKGEDEKVIVVPDDSVDPDYKEINDISDLNEALKNKIIHFFKNYKVLEENKWVTVKEFKDNVFAKELYKKSLIKK
jgi:inorganic pyrophosphatase